VSVVGWGPLCLPSLAVNWVVGKLVLWKLCTVPVGTPRMFACSALVGVLTVALGPVLTALVLYKFRRLLAGLVRSALARLRSEPYLVAPVVATAVFLVAWAGTHHSTPHVGLLPNVLFPAVVGLFTHWTAARSRQIQERFEGFFRARDRVPRWLRMAATVLLPTLFAASLASRFSAGGTVAFPTEQQQLVVIVGLLVGYSLMVPRQGDPLGAARRVVERLGAR
jgi:hypothetical protein